MKDAPQADASAASCSGRCLPGASGRGGRLSASPEMLSASTDSVFVPVSCSLPRSRSGPGPGPDSPPPGPAEQHLPARVWELERRFSRWVACLERGTVASLRVFLLLVLLFLIPTLLNLVCNRSTEGGPPSWDPRFHFRRNVRGERVYRTPRQSAKMVRHPERRAKAALVVLARDADLEAVLLSQARLEQRFNRKYDYPWVFLNDADFSEEFKNRTSAATSAPTRYARIPPEHWSYPPWVTPAAAQAARASMASAGVLYGGRESYHHMCRYFSGFFAKHPALREFDFYWRVEPDVHFYCDLDYDPFLYMQERHLKYGFVISILELPKTIPSLWAQTQAFMRQQPGLLPARNLLPFVTDADGGYNHCHFWSNFEIGDLNFLRSPAYTAYFEHLDRAGGFYLERWGDAPVHSLGVAMLLNASEVHWFQDIGYRHNSMKHCPATQRNNCDCDAIEAVAFHTPSYGVCHQRWQDFLKSQPR